MTATGGGGPPDGRRDLPRGRPLGRPLRPLWRRPHRPPGPGEARGCPARSRGAGAGRGRQRAGDRRRRTRPVQGRHPVTAGPGALYLDYFLATDGRPGPGAVYVLHFLEPIGNPANRRAMARHYIGKPVSSGLLKGGWRVSGGGFAELGRLGWPVGVVESGTGGSASQGRGLPGRDM